MSTIQQKQPKIFELFKRILINQTLKHAYLFEGYAGTGKLEMSRYISKAKLCQNVSKDGQEPCNDCSHCKRIDNGEHPDVIEVSPEGKSQTIKVDRVRELKEEFSKSAVEGNTKMIIVDNVDAMTINATNSLLKFIEEPEDDIHIFLLTANKQNVLPTIISRCQVISFIKQPISERIDELKESRLNDYEAHLIAHLTQDNQLGRDMIAEYEIMDKAEKVWRWFSRVIKKDDRAFVFVQTDLLPMIDGTKESMMMLDLIMYLCRDMLQLYYNPELEAIAFSQHRSDLTYYVERMSIMTIVSFLTSVLTAKKRLKSNVSIQGVLEHLTLELLGY